MTRINDAMRHGPVPMDEVEAMFNDMRGLPPTRGTGNQTLVKRIPVHILRCDTCGHEYHSQPTPEYVDYVPDGWAEYQDGTHKCPSCRTKRSLERDEQIRNDVIKRGGSVEELRAALRAVHWGEPD